MGFVTFVSPNVRLKPLKRFFVALVAATHMGGDQKRRLVRNHDCKNETISSFGN